MLFDPRYFPYFCGCSLLLFAVCFLCAGYAYRVNARRARDDPEMREFRGGAIYLAPITLPLFLLSYATLMLIKALLYLIFLIIFTIGVVAFRKQFLLKWLDKIAKKIGNPLLEANTFLIKAFWAENK